MEKPEEIEQEIARLRQRQADAVLREHRESERRLEAERADEKQQRLAAEAATKLRIEAHERRRVEDIKMERVWWQQKWAGIYELLPGPPTMPKCADCGARLVFRDLPPYSDTDSIVLRCPNCKTLISSKWPENPFRVVEVSSAIW